MILHSAISAVSIWIFEKKFIRERTFKRYMIIISDKKDTFGV